MRSFADVRAVAVLLLASVATALAQQNPESLFAEAKRREGVLREEIDSRKAGSTAAPLLERARTLTQSYEDLAKLFPRSNVGDDALLQGGALAAAAFSEFGQPADRGTALRLFTELETRFPASPLLRTAREQAVRLGGPAALPRSSLLSSVKRDVLPDALRITLELEREARFDDERIDGPSRVVIDLFDTRVVEALKDATLTYGDDVVQRIRVGRQRDARTRVVLDLKGAARHSVYALYNPYRVVIDVERTPLATSAPDTKRAVTSPPPSATRPAAPVTNADGGFSLSRQLGLGIARIVIDPGHGGHDPGAEARGLTEAEVTLDVALRLEKLLSKQPGVEVLLTRRANTFVPLEERTAIANRAEADLFLSIHTNANANTRTTGVETYILNFASNSRAEAVAARENAGSLRTMRELPDIVKAIALNNKIDESRDFAASVQASMFEGVRRTNKQARNLGVKQAPFMVLIGARMPSVLAEISFLTNRQEAALLRTAKYRDQIAAALMKGVMKYQTSLKASQRIAAQ
jgi:N-acetylmuramoyl-L-alanine amidase